jgi:SRSO17 transposase
LIDRRLDLPEAWAGDAERRHAAKIPDAVPFRTKPEIARAMIARALDAGVPCDWVLGDEVYGADRRLRWMLEERGRPYVLAIRGNDRLGSELAGEVGRHEPGQLARALPPQAWRRLSAGAGTKGERWYDWARVRLARPQEPPWEHWLLVRRSVADPDDLAYFVVFAPPGLRLLDLARAAGRRWLVEECFPPRTGLQPAGDPGSRPPSRRSAWPTTRCGAGTAGTGTSPSPCWRSRSWPACGPP